MSQTSFVEGLEKATKIKRDRICSGWGLREIARQVGVSPQTVIRWEKHVVGKGPKFQEYMDIINWVHGPEGNRAAAKETI